MKTPLAENKAKREREEGREGKVEEEEEDGEKSREGEGLSPWIKLHLNSLVTEVNKFCLV